ncbi:NAD-dependent succinate-semialdehyde dehydrogenase [Steroidobacter agaridevorans]|uniref:NAD-dependent succinate-semialdehyde dehydrogenase n=1 Tax=Steroidobacter agaridevorans TaxID=2695856 RepID=A0A829YBS0_9GAMM|nr:NAD-dependent succinate-semialdehyde dehydrogenase [Steroidobacter agaridevorans]GFE80106.1 NAD-dependent succinate-semialdehyde dehydrogenase [Steroidobacter agaridevorans]
MKSTNNYLLPAASADPGRAIPTDLLIGDRWRGGAEGQRIDVINPSTGDVLASVADATVKDGIESIEAASRAAPGWAATPPRKRAELLRSCFERMVANSEWLAQLISLENGKALADARSEVLYAAEFFRWYAEEAVRLEGEISTAPSGANHIVVMYQPIGISLLITPWNFPAAMATRKIAPALAAGCTCILKPAEETPLTAYAVAQIMLEAGIPAGVVNVITTGKPAAVVKAMLHEGRIRKLSFTGSTEVGRLLLHEAADTIVNCSMELGGNAPFLVLDDANIPEAIAGAMIAKMRNGGEACTAANRFYVQRGVYEEFTRQLVAKMGAVKLGDGCSPETGCGALINRAAVAKIESLVADAVKRGARVLLGGAAPSRPGFFYPPTVLTDVAAGSEILNQEIFGPVAVLVPFDTVDEAIALANDTEYGLVAYIYTGDLKTGLRIAERLESGMIALNRGLVSDAAAPFGGVKQSGLGREGSHHGIREFTEAKYIAVEW